MHISLKLLIIILRCSKSVSVWHSSGLLYFTFDFYKDDRIHILYEQHIRTHKYQQLHQHQFLKIAIQNLIRDPQYQPSIPHMIPILAFCFGVILAKFVQSADNVDRNAAAADIITL